MKKSKKLKYSINSSIIIIGAIIAVILANSILVAFDDKISLEIDLTQNEIYKLSDATKEVAKSIDKETKVGILYDGRELDESDEFLSVMKLIVDEYTEENEKITCQLIDYYNDPTPLLRDFPEGAVLEISSKEINPLYAMIIVQGDKFEVAGADSYFVKSYDQNEGRIKNKSAIEKVLTNKLASFTSTEKDFSVILYTTGHGEKVQATIGSILTKNDYTPGVLEVETLKDTGDDNPLVIIDAPATDFTQEEIETIDAFLKDGGNLQVYFNPLLSNDELPRLETYLAEEWGIIRNHGVIYDNEKALTLDDEDKTNYGTIAVGNYTDHDIVKSIKASELRVMYSSANALEIAADIESKTQVTPVIETSDGALLKSLETAITPETSDGIKGKYNVMLLSEKNIYQENGTIKTGKVLVCGSSYVMDTLPLNSDCANEELLINSFKWMSGNNSAIDIEAKTFPTGSLVIENTPKWIWFATLVVVIPLAIIAAGMFVFIKRRYK